jgi:hypothetical protein
VARWVTPRYEVQLVRNESKIPPILVWGRHRWLFLARQAMAAAVAHVPSDAAHFIVLDRWTGRTVAECRFGEE